MTENYPILLRENISIEKGRPTREEAIIHIGNRMVATHYVTTRYVQGMLDRDRNLSVYLGNMLAIPHGEYEVKDEILHSGVAIAIYPEGIDWGGEEVKVVLGLAGKGKEHMELLSHIAGLFSEESTVKEIVEEKNVETLYDLFTRSL